MLFFQFILFPIFVSLFKVTHKFQKGMPRDSATVPAAVILDEPRTMSKATTAGFVSAGRYDRGERSVRRPATKSRSIFILFISSQLFLAVTDSSTPDSVTGQAKTKQTTS